MDGDDYTWDDAPSGAAVFKAKLDVAWDEYWQRTERDLRTADQVERNDVAALTARVAELERELHLLILRVDGSTRVAQLERQLAALLRVLEVRLTNENGDSHK